jgi:cytochrome c-type biogenesis protein CcmH/NrfF
MPSSLTADDYKAVEEHLRKEYFLVRSQTVWLVVALFAAFGIGTVATAYSAAKAAIGSEAAKIATDDIVRFKGESEQELEQIRAKRAESVKIVSGLAPEIGKLNARNEAMAEEVRTKKLVISDGQGANRILMYVAEPYTHFVMYDPAREKRAEVRADQYGGFIEFVSGPQSSGVLQFHKEKGVNSIANK